MENDTNLKLVEELVNAKDELSGVRYDFAVTQVEYRQTRNNLNALIGIILNNTKLDYSETDLSLVNDNSILQFINFLEPDSYKDRLEELKKEAQENRDNAVAKIAENLKKEARKNGKS